MTEKGSKASDYFNFPIQLLNGFMVFPLNVLDDIFHYALYAHTRKLDKGDDEKKMRDAHDFFNVTSVKSKTLIEGRKLYNSIPLKSPFTGISKDVYYDFYKNDKTDFDKAVLLAFLAIKSILGTDSFKKIDNTFLLSRMDGKVKSIKDYSELSKEVFKYSHHYAVRKLKEELRNNWGLIEYSRYTRGFWISFFMPLEEIVFQAEKRRKSTKEKAYKNQINEAREKALLRLNKETT